MIGGTTVACGPRPKRPQVAVTPAVTVDSVFTASPGNHHQLCKFDCIENEIFIDTFQIENLDFFNNRSVRERPGILDKTCFEKASSSV